MPTRTRIAPSPTGFPHVGTIFQALIDYVLAKQGDGQFVIRIEDTDQSRKVDGAEEAIYQSLQWAGLSPDEGPAEGGDYGPYRQSERLDLYKKYADQLVEQGDAYYAFDTPERLAQMRQDQQKQGIPPMYDQRDRNLDPAEAAERAKTEKHVIRMKVPADETIVVTDEIRGQISIESNTVDDQVIMKSDGFPTYHLAVVVDDHLMGITHLVRGEEWISSAPKHVLLHRYLGWEMPKLIHTPLLRNPNKSKLGKRHGHASVSWYQEQGYLPDAVINFLATRVWNHPEDKEVFDLDEMIKHFQVSDMNIQGPIVDLDKLAWYNGLYIRAMSDEDLAEWLSPYKDQALSQEKLLQIIPLIKERLVCLSEIVELTDFFYQEINLEAQPLLKKSDKKEVLHQLRHTLESLENVETFDVSSIETAIRSLQETHEWKKGQYFMMVRQAVTGKKATPPLFETIEVLGKELTIKRLNQAIEVVSNHV